ncbi:hypothetical protein SVAN01_08374 [Stagonosporopsis vannaccii]|nr:hypothetical protein SVAN01_08374 [Stagonosporopsis vannaccii]
MDSCTQAPALPLGPPASGSLCAPPYCKTLVSWKQISLVDLCSNNIKLLVDHFEQTRVAEKHSLALFRNGQTCKAQEKWLDDIESSLEDVSKE